MLKIIAVSGTDIPPEAGIRREAMRPVRLQEQDFSNKFDSSTLLYDAIRHGSGDGIRIIAPALLNIRGPLERSNFYLTGSDTPLEFRIRDLDRQSQIIVKGRADTTSLSLKGELGRIEIKISDDEADLFAGRRVVFVQSKNNKLVWIKDWLEFYRNVHGADAVLFYDNRSDLYDNRALADTLCSVSGIKTVVVVDWPFKHGPVGMGLHKHWDSDFSKLGMLEHARWRFLSRARSVLNCDIDELVVSHDGDSLFERVERSTFGIEAFRGTWVHAIDGLTRAATPEVPLRFADFRHSYVGVTERRIGVIRREVMRCQPKWAVVPSRTPVGAQWHVHQIKGWWASRLMSRSVRFRHFSEINTSWKYDRSIRDSAASMRQREDPQLQRDFRQVGWIDRRAGSAVE